MVFFQTRLYNLFWIFPFFLRWINLLKLLERQMQIWIKYYGSYQPIPLPANNLFIKWHLKSHRPREGLKIRRCKRKFLQEGKKILKKLLILLANNELFSIIVKWCILSYFRGPFEKHKKKLKNNWMNWWETFEHQASNINSRTPVIYFSLFVYCGCISDVLCMCVALSLETVQNKT
jgi:hypothetical protein